MAPDGPESTPQETRQRWKGEPEATPSRPPPLPPRASAPAAADDALPPLVEPVPDLPPGVAVKFEADLPPRVDEPQRSDGADSVGGTGDSDEPEEPDHWVSRDLFRSVLSFFVSMFVHLVLLLAGALCLLPAEERAKLVAVVFDVREEVERELETVELDERDEAAVSLSFAHSSGDPISGPQSVHFRAAERVEIDTDMVDQLSAATGPAEIGIDDPLDIDFNDRELLQELPDGAVGVARAVVDGYGEAFDRITMEIEQLLYGGPVLVIWCFDRSYSMKDDQQEIRERITRVYAELDQISHASGGALKSAVTSFGEDFQVMTPEPLHDPSVIQLAIGSLTTDPSGKEYMCQAVATSISGFQEFAHRQRRRMALILVTDESGEREDNAAHLEATIAIARAARCRIYVLGAEAVFGYPHVYFSYRHPQTGRVHWLLADRGPETAFVEQLQTNGFHRRHDAFGSGFGPYEQSRLARESGGIFFLLPSVEESIVRGEKRRYELEQMRYYKPDLRARQEIFFDRDQSPLRLLLWKIIYDLDPLNAQAKEVTEVDVHFSPDPRTFARQVTTQIPRAKIHLGYLAEAADIVEKNREMRDREPEIRWQANYDLMLAQLFAYQARLYEYTAYLQLFMQNPRVIPLAKAPNLQLTHWEINVPPDDHRGGDRTLRKKGHATVRGRHRTAPGHSLGRPAQLELSRGYGVELVPVYEPPYIHVGNPSPLPKL